MCVESWVLTLHEGRLHLLMCCLSDVETLKRSRFIVMRDNYSDIEERARDTPAIVKHLHILVAREFHGVVLERINDITYGAIQESYNDKPHYRIFWYRICMIVVDDISDVIVRSLDLTRTRNRLRNDFWPAMFIDRFQDGIVTLDGYDCWLPLSTIMTNISDVSHRLHPISGG